MLKIDLSVTIPIKTSDGDEFEITLRDFTEEEQKENKKLFKKYNSLVTKLAKYERRLENILKRIELYEKTKETKKLESALNKKDELDDKLEELVDEFTTFSEDDFELKMAKRRFDLCIGGDIDSAEKIAKSIGYVNFLEKLDTEKLKSEEESKKKLQKPSKGKKRV